MVKTMSASQVKPVSTRPPTKAPSDPRVTAMIVEIAAARYPIVRMGQPPWMIWESTSLPSESVPRGWLHDGVSYIWDTSTVSSSGTKSGPTKLTKTMVTTRMKPAKPTLLRAMSLSVEAILARNLPTADSLYRLSPVAAAIRSVPPSDPDARVEPGIEQVGQQVGQDDHRRDHQENPLHDRVIPLLDGVVEYIAEPLVDEEPLDEERPAKDERYGDAQLGEGRERGVPAHIGGGYPAFLDTPCFGHGNVVLAQSRLGAAPHREHPQSDGAEHVGGYGQGSVVERIADEREVETGLNPRRERTPHGRDVNELPLDTDPHHDEDAHEVIGDGADYGPQVGEDVVERRLPPVGHYQPEQDPNREADDERRADAEERPGQVVQDDLAHRYAARDERLSQVSSHQVAQILQILLVDGHVEVEREQRASLLHRALVRHVVLGNQVGDVGLHRAARHEPYQEESQGGHHEDGYQRFDQASKKVAGSHLSQHTKCPAPRSRYTRPSQFPIPSHPQSRLIHYTDDCASRRKHAITKIRLCEAIRAQRTGYRRRSF